MDTVASGQTDVGRKRDHNEDYLLIRPDLGLHMVCDGMGGHAAGEVASEMATQTTLEYIEEHRDIIDNYQDDDESNDRIVTLVREAIELASATVFEHATSHEGRAGMGCTLTMMLVVGHKAVMGHVGDSRMYLSRRGVTYQMSEDHSYLNEMRKRGRLTPEIEANKRYKNVISRAIGIRSSVLVDTLLFDVLSDDVYLICSDGLCDYTTTEELEMILHSAEVEALPQKLIDLANERGGKDNITTLIIGAGRAAERADDDLTLEVNLRLDTLKFVWLFKHLSMKEMVYVLNAFRSVDYGPGEEVVAEGETSDGLYVILEGNLEVVRDGQVVANLEAGTHFGEMALLNKRPRSATVRTTDNARLLVMTCESFKECIRQDPRIGVKFLWPLAQVLSLRLDEATNIASQVGGLEPPPVA